jgi:hypothetical protein
MADYISRPDLLLLPLRVRFLERPLYEKGALFLAGSTSAQMPQLLVENGLSEITRRFSRARGADEVLGHLVDVHERTEMVNPQTGAT